MIESEAAPGVVKIAAELVADQFISIDLDDGVRHNYEIFKDVLAKIK